MTSPQNPDWATILAQIPVATSPPNSDTEDLDTDTNTDSFLLAAWVDIFGEWPGSTTTDLMTLTFNVIQTENGFPSGTTPINIMSTSVAAGFTFDGQNHTINFDGVSGVTTPALSASNIQIVYASSSTRSQDLTQQTVVISYKSDADEVTGLGLRIHYDGTKLELVNVSNVLETGLFIRPEHEPDGARDALFTQASGRVFRKMTIAEQTLFDYVSIGYIEDNPNEATRDSYVGNYQFGITGP